MEAKPRSRSGRRHAVAEAEVTNETESDELRLEALTKSQLDLLARYG